MPRAERPAADAANPDVEPVPDAPTEQSPAEPVASQPGEASDAATDDGPQWGNWRYVGAEQLTYAAVPVTVRPGDVIVHLGPPAGDGRWKPTDDKVTRH